MFTAKRIRAIFFVLLLTVFMQSKVLAAELSLPTTKINPDKYLFYSFKRVFEKGIIFTKFTNNSRADYYRDLTQARMAELKFVVEHNLLSEVQKSTERLSYQIGILSDYIADKSDLAYKKQNISDFLKSYKGSLGELRDKYPANSAYWMLIQHNINSIDINLEKLK